MSRLMRYTESNGAGGYRLKDGYGIRYRYADARVQEAIDRLADYEEAEESGLLVRLPYKLGDMIYYVDAACDECVYADTCSLDPPDDECPYVVREIEIKSLTVQDAGGGNMTIIINNWYCFDRNEMVNVKQTLEEAVKWKDKRRGIEPCPD